MQNPNDRGTNPYFGFNTTQIAALERLAKSNDQGLASLSQAIFDIQDWAAQLVAKLNADHAAANAQNALPLTLDTDYQDMSVPSV